MRWEINLGSAVTGFPITYAVDGRQFGALTAAVNRAFERGLTLVVRPELQWFPVGCRGQQLRRCDVDRIDRAEIDGKRALRLVDHGTVHRREIRHRKQLGQLLALDGGLGIAQAAEQPLTIDGPERFDLDESGGDHMLAGQQRHRRPGLNEQDSEHRACVDVLHRDPRGRRGATTGCPRAARWWRFSERPSPGSPAGADPRARGGHARKAARRERGPTRQSGRPDL